ncbi:MAG: hypothetical protein ACR2RV_06855 [Verrucomicrobiales bacterium]
MNRSLVIHCCYFLVTVGTFVAGSQFSRTSASSSEIETDDGDGNKRFRVGSEQRLSALPSQFASQGGLENSIDGELIHNDWQIAPAASGEIPRKGGLRLEKFALENGPLTEEQIEELVLAAIKSSDPLERRRAFDRLLQEIESDTFTVAQAMSIRKTMHDNGASGEQWRMFDYAWGANDPSAAIAYIDEIPEQYRDGYLGNMMPGLASENPQAAIDLFRSLEPDLQGKLRPRFLEGLVDNDVAAATDYLYESSDPENRDWRPMDQLAREIEKDRGLESTLAWAEELPEGSLRNNAWSAAYAVWAGRDPQAAVASIVDLPPSTDRDLAINGFTAAYAHEDGERAAIWAAEISNPSLREEALIRAGTQYFRQDESAATTWFESSGLPETSLSRMGRPSQIGE